MRRTYWRSMSGRFFGTNDALLTSVLGTVTRKRSSISGVLKNQKGRDLYLLARRAYDLFLHSISTFKNSSTSPFYTSRSCPSIQHPSPQDRRFLLDFAKHQDSLASYAPTLSRFTIPVLSQDPSPSRPSMPPSALDIANNQDTLAS
jgi:hypothetical protein